MIDAWDKRKLGEVGDIIGGGTPSTDVQEYWNGNVDWYVPAEIGGQIFVNGSQRKITEIGLKTCSAKILPIGSILFTSRAGIGNTAILAKEGSTNQGFQSIVPQKGEVDSYFIFSRTNELKRYGKMVGAGSTFIEVSGKQMAQMPMLIPSLSEQTAIGNFFSTLDNILTLQKRKLDSLKKLKKGYLQQMFPQEGESEPCMRFKGFTGEWEEKTLNQVAKIVKGEQKGKQEINEKQTDENSIPVFNGGKSPSGFTNVSNRIGKVMISEGGSCGFVNYYEGEFWSGGHNYTLNEQKSHTFYLKSILESKQEKLYRLGVGSGLQNIQKHTIESFIVEIPKFQEQTVIGNFFKNIDEQIAIQQTKLNQLKQLKAAYLQKMFI